MCRNLVIMLRVVMLSVRAKLRERINSKSKDNWLSKGKYHCVAQRASN